MRHLESVDFSLNQLSGVIPSSMSSLSLLSHLNLSYNNLTGTIPSSTQLQSMTESSFLGNKLCGPPLPTCKLNKTVPPNVVPNGSDEEGEGIFGSVVLCKHYTWICSWVLGCVGSFTVQEVLENCLFPGDRRHLEQSLRFLF
ncbi:hypothetical protein Vadar_001689 [Vaccinium darrowii]|uniref:Uncharacterized protein n=1 Tax=Vaccinium darrowii TaxID=229202 RepID=A0ACB7YIX2_9ERIC|nr:hypothetical protein Vadar_001689 [Vaccinium darrowii]